MDIQAAYVHVPLLKPVHMQPPPGLTIPENHVLEVNMVLYGLMQSGHEWSNHHDMTFAEAGFKKCALFFFVTTRHVFAIPDGSTTAGQGEQS